MSGSLFGQHLIPIAAISQGLPHPRILVCKVSEYIFRTYIVKYI